jgi:EAL domain-containing protein (putative c-di-GMP-specific phosphodiesterase class I)
MAPEVFIPLAETTELIVPYQHWLVRTATAQARSWVRRDHCALRLVFNPSTVHLGTAHVEHLIRLMRWAVDTNVCPLELEFPQASLINCPQPVFNALGRLRDLGLGLTLTGFGTDLCSLRQLEKLPITRVKIDASLVQGIESDRASATIVQAAIALAQSFRLLIRADGIETAGQLRFLRDHGGDEGQGAFFSSPVTAQILGDLLEQSDLARAAEDDPDTVVDLPPRAWLTRVASNVFQRLRG